MGSSGSSPDNTVRYPEYWEAAHEQTLAMVQASVGAAMGTSPFGDAVVFNVRDGFFSEGYAVESFPSLWDMFGKFMAGVDVHTLWQQTFNNIVTSPEINNAVTAQAAYLDDDMDAKILPRFHGGMRSINAVQSSAFISGRAILEDARVKAINKFASEIRLRAVDLSATMWGAHLRWNEAVITSYSNMFKLYFSVEMDTNAQTMEMKNRDTHFDLGLYEYLRAMFGVVSGGAGTTPTQEPSQAAKSISGALGGAALGAQVYGAPGAVVGGVIGLAASFL